MSEDKEKKEENIVAVEKTEKKVKNSVENSGVKTNEKKQSTNNNKESIGNVDKQSTNISNNVSEMKYSGFWVRGAAHLIDAIIIFFVALFVLIPTSIVIGIVSAFLGPFGVFLQFLSGFLGLFLTWAYFIFMTNKYQATFGKMAVGVKVYAENGDKLTLGDIILRETIGKIVSTIIFGIGYVMIAFTGKKQGLHDIIARSVVTYNNPSKGPNTPVVAVTYILYGLLMFVAIMLIVIFSVGLSLFIIAATSNSTGTGGFFDEIKSGFMENNMNDSEYYMNDFDMDEFDIDEFDYMM
jgi:uncharacterized RDD family membrane protein YckC